MLWDAFNQFDASRTKQLTTLTLRIYVFVAVCNRCFVISQLLQHVTIASAGVMPKIVPLLLPRKKGDTGASDTPAVPPKSPKRSAVPTARISKGKKGLTGKSKVSVAKVTFSYYYQLK